MAPDEERLPGDSAEVTPLPERNEMHYDRRTFERVDWTHGGAHMQTNHGITPDVANEALGDPNRLVIDPDYNSTSGRSVRIIGLSTTVEDIITVIVIEDAGVEYGVNGWGANQKDRRHYGDAGTDRVNGEADEQED